MTNKIDVEGIVEEIKSLIPDEFSNTKLTDWWAFDRRTKEILTTLLTQAEEEKRQDREKLRVHIEREVIDPLVDTLKPKFGINEAVDALREALTPTSSSDKTEV